MTRADSKSNAEPLDPLRFESLLAGLSAKFISVPTDQVDAIIEEAQRRICEWLGIDLCVLWQWEFDTPGIFTLTHYYRRVHGPPISRQLRASEHFPWGLREVQAGRSVIISSMDDVPAGAERDQETRCHFGVKDVVLLPLSTGGGSPFGAVSFSDMVTPRTWSEALVKRLELIAQLFANAIFRKRSDQALRESDARRSLAIEAADAGPWVLDARGERFWVTPRIMELFGLPPGDALDVERFVELVHPDDRQAVRDAMAESVQSRQMRVIEYRLVRSDGQVRWMQSRGRLCGEAEGVRLMGITSDITERKQREEVLRAGEARIASAVDVAGLGFYELGENAHVTFMDDRIRAMFGIPPQEEPRASDYWVAHIHPEDLPRVRQMSREIQEEGIHEAEAEYRYMHPSRGRLWLHHLARVQARDAAGRVIRLLGVVQDITDRKEGQVALEESRAQIAAVMNSTTDFIWSVDPERFGLLTWNRAFRDYFFERRGIELGVGMTPAELVPPDYVPLWHDLFSRALCEGLVTAEYVVVARTNTLLLSLHAMRRDGRAFGISVFGRDITDRKRLEENLTDQLRFETLLADVSTRLVSLPSGELDRETGWVLHQMLEFYHADRCTLWRIVFQKNMVKAISVVREEPVQPLPSDIDMAGLLPWSVDTLIAEHKPIVVNSLDALPAEAQIDRKNYQALGIQSILLIPVFIAETLAFIISVSSVTCERIWPEHCIPRLRLLTEALANALVRKRAEEELRESCEAFQSLAGRLLSAQEEERRLLARELHDDLSQRLAIISIGIGKLERLSGSVPDEVVTQLKEIRERVIDLSSDVHDISRQLHPSIIEDLGLDRAIQSECAHFTQREGIWVRYRSKDVPAAIPIDTAVCLFRVIQEGLRNIAKHAKVKEANVNLTGAEDRIILTIQDAGVGFGMTQPAARPALGLTSMKERMHLIRGEFMIESTPGKGTTITVVAPLFGVPK
jgi:PAS domain S-box-containing protein